MEYAVSQSSDRRDRTRDLLTLCEGGSQHSSDFEIRAGCDNQEIGQDGIDSSENSGFDGRSTPQRRQNHSRHTMEACRIVSGPTGHNKIDTADYWDRVKVRLSNLSKKPAIKTKQVSAYTIPSGRGKKSLPVRSKRRGK